MKPPQVITRTTPAADLPELLRVDEVARWAAVGRGTIYEAIRRGDLAHISIGRLVRVPRTAVEAWLNASADQERRSVNRLKVVS